MRSSSVSDITRKEKIFEDAHKKPKKTEATMYNISQEDRIGEEMTQKLGKRVAYSKAKPKAKAKFRKGAEDPF